MRNFIKNIKLQGTQDKEIWTITNPEVILKYLNDTYVSHPISQKQYAETTITSIDEAYVKLKLYNTSPDDKINNKRYITNAYIVFTVSIQTNTETKNKAFQKIIKKSKTLLIDLSLKEIKSIKKLLTNYVQ